MAVAAEAIAVEAAVEVPVNVGRNLRAATAGAVTVARQVQIANSRVVDLDIEAVANDRPLPLPLWLPNPRAVLNSWRLEPLSRRRR